MMEERKNAAASVISHCERMYEETANPYYVVDALHAARWGSFTPPDWAIKVLLDAVHSAMTRHHTSGKRISIDSALGLAITRGKAPQESEARKANIEDSAFRLTKTIHTCFDVSIPTACETVYYAIDRNFAQGMEEVFEHDRKIFENVVDNEGESDAVKEKLQSFKWWTVTRGERLGYSLERFIERYYRVGGKRRAIDTGRFHGEEQLFIQGHFLLVIPEDCARAIEIKDGPGYRLRGISSLLSTPKRPAFAQFHQAIVERTEAKSGI